MANDCPEERRDNVAESAALESNDNGLDALCWGCLRCGWDCLCQWPLDRQGRTIERIEEREIVTGCLLYWPEPRANEPLRRYKRPIQQRRESRLVWVDDADGGYYQVVEC